VNLSNRKRTSLQKRADRVLDRLQGTIVVAPKETSPKSCAILATERTKPHLMARTTIQPALHAMGLHLDGLEELLEEVARAPEDDGARYPVIILIEGWATVAFIDAPALAAGGDA